MPPLSARAVASRRQEPNPAATTTPDADLHGEDGSASAGGVANRQASAANRPVATPARQSVTRTSSGDDGTQAGIAAIPVGLIWPIKPPDDAVTPAGARDPKPAAASGGAGDGVASPSAASAAPIADCGAVTTGPTVPDDSGVTTAPSTHAALDVTGMGAAAGPAILPADIAASSPVGGHARPGGSSATDAASSATPQTAPSAVSAMAPELAAGPGQVVAPDPVQAIVATLDAGAAPVAQPVPVPVLTTEPAATQLDASGAPAQVGASLLTLASSADGSSQISVSLHPKELGAVRVQLELAPDGTARIVVAADNPGTLRSLMADQEHLHAALDAASIATGGRHVSFELAPSPSATGADAGARDHHPGAFATSPGPGAQAGGDMAGWGGSGRHGQGGSAGGSAGGDRSDGPGGGNDTTGLPLIAASILTARLLPSGSINITA